MSEIWLRTGEATVLASEGQFTDAMPEVMIGHVKGPVGQAFASMAGQAAGHPRMQVLDSTDPETIEFAKDDSTLFFRIGSRLLTSRQLTGQFPNFEAVLPKDNSKIVPLNSSDLNSAILRVAQFADERSRAVRLRLEKGELKISASSTEAGESEDSIEAPYTGETLTIGFNAQYLVDFLKASGTSEVRLELKDPQSAGQFRPAEGDDYKYRYIVMPMRI